ncbi:MAG: hypothetical protein M1820_005185 [Bogoriella megaspora]|nr:MAG: hypothetical protein M1820_005185 [Bogoriella megaspora]
MHFYALPPEIRNQIYLHLFTPSLPYPPLLLSNPPNPPPASVLLGPLLTSRLFHAEAASLAYTLVPFLTHTAIPFHLQRPPLTPLRQSSIRHIILTTRITSLRALSETWDGLPFGSSSLRLASLTIIPQRAEAALFEANAEVADLSQCHTLAFILTEFLVRVERGVVGRLEVRNQGCFVAEMMGIVWRSLVYRLWKQRRGCWWDGEGEGLGFEERGDGGVVWIGDGDGDGNGVGMGTDGKDRGRGLDEEVMRLSGRGTGSGAGGWGFVAMP